MNGWAYRQPQRGAYWLVRMTLKRYMSYWQRHSKRVAESLKPISLMFAGRYSQRNIHGKLCYSSGNAIRGPPEMPKDALKGSTGKRRYPEISPVHFLTQGTSFLGVQYSKEHVVQLPRRTFFSSGNTIRGPPEMRKGALQGSKAERRYTEIPPVHCLTQGTSFSGVQYSRDHLVQLPWRSLF